MDNDSNQYENEIELNNAKLEVNNVQPVEPVNNSESEESGGESIIESSINALGSEVKKKVKNKIISQIIIYVGPVILGFFAFIIIVGAVLGIFCVKIPFSSTFLEICKGVDFSDEEKQIIRNTSNIDNAVSATCASNGGVYNEKTKSCGYGY